METKASKKFIDFCNDCVKEKKNPYTVEKQFLANKLNSSDFAKITPELEALEAKFDVEAKSLISRSVIIPESAGEGLVELADKIYEDGKKVIEKVYEGYDLLTQEIADWWYGNK